MNTNKIKATSGPWSVWPHTEYGLVTDDALGRHIATISGGTHEYRANAVLIAAAGTSATQCESLGYDGVKCVEGVGELLKVLKDLLKLDELDFGDESLLDATHPKGAANELLAKLK